MSRKGDVSMAQIKRFVYVFTVVGLLLMGSMVSILGGIPCVKGQRTRAAPEIVSSWPPGSTTTMVEGQTDNYNYSVSVSDADNDDLAVTWFINGTEMKNETISGGSGKSEFFWIPPYDAVTSGIMAQYKINVSVYDGTSYANRTWTAKVYEASPPTEMNQNQSNYTKPLSIRAVYLYNEKPKVEVTEGLSISELSGNKTFGNPLFGYSYSILYNITQYIADPNYPFPTVKYINMSIDFSNSTFKSEFDLDTIRIVAWDFTRGHWNDVENIGEYKDLTIRKGTIKDRYISWLNVTFGSGTRTGTRTALSLEYLFHIALFGYRPLWVKYTSPDNGATEVPYSTSVNVTFNHPLISIDDLKTILKDKYGWDDETVNQTAANITTVNATLLNETPVYGAIVLTDDSGTEVGGTYEYDMSFRKLIFTPEQPLQPGTTYTAKVKKEIMDVFGHSLDGNQNFKEGEDGDDYIWQFTTKEIVTIPPGPKVIETYPANGSTDVPLGVKVSIVFDRDMNPDTFPGNVSFMDTNYRRVNATMNYSATNHTLFLAPTKPLESSTTYIVSLEYKVQDVNGYHLDGNGDGHEGYSIMDNYQFTFTTLTVYYGNITVTVKDANTSTPIPGVGLELSGPVKKIGSTDENGTATFWDLPLGNYSLYLTHPDYFEKNVDIQLGLDNLTPAITVELVKNKTVVVENHEPQIWKVLVNGTLMWENGTAVKADIDIYRGENLTLEVIAIDPDGDTLTYEWDLDIYSDSDNADGDNNDTTGADDDTDATGAMIEWIYNRTDIYKIQIRVSDGKDEAMLTPNFRINIINRSSGPGSGGGGFTGSTGNATPSEEMMILGMPAWLFGAVVIIVVLVIAIGFAAFKLREAGEEEEEEEEEEGEDETIACPNCGREISAYAEKCPYCNADLSLEEE